MSSPEVSANASDRLAPAGSRRCKRLRLVIRWPTEKVIPATEANAAETNRSSQISMGAGLNPEVHHAVDDKVRDHQRHPSINQGGDKGRTAGEFGKIVLRKQANGAIEDEGHGGEKPRRQTPFGAQRFDLELERAALAHERREPSKH